MEFRHDHHDTGEAKLHFASIGNPEHPLVICLHGFPEYWAAWGAVMAELADGFHLVAPDQRGFNLSSKPAAIDAYRIRHMVADLASLADRLSPGRPFVLAGHDWGASVAYAFAFAHPGRLSHLVIANGVHPVCFQRAILDDPGQRTASQYINRLKANDAETLLSEDGYRRLFRMIEGFSKIDFMDERMKAEYLNAWRQPGALTGMLNWYRASPVAVPAPGEEAGGSLILDMPREAFKVAMPHLVVWGDADEALRPACIEGLEDFAPDLTVRRIDGAGHWILHEKPALVARTMREFLADRAGE
ncbi:alpha/beta fold hydrolase [Aquamicrobium sp. LC103]|uniref:alpha/beta fold hydrolase n=1 Tax=Aquamicrobium sp. LC103 TaxID=1120658 RepID=UPI00063EBDBA|nr:alpha/beta fold hydrolase [Aquamicrobium sp. LC103]